MFGMKVSQLLSFLCACYSKNFMSVLCPIMMMLNYDDVEL